MDFIVSSAPRTRCKFSLGWNPNVGHNPDLHFYQKNRLQERDILFVEFPPCALETKRDRRDALPAMAEKPQSTGIQTGYIPMVVGNKLIGWVGTATTIVVSRKVCSLVVLEYIRRLRVCIAREQTLSEKTSTQINYWNSFPCLLPSTYSINFGLLGSSIYLRTFFRVLSSVFYDVHIFGGPYDSWYFWDDFHPSFFI